MYSSAVRAESIQESKHPKKRQCHQQRLPSLCINFSVIRDNAMAVLRGTEGAQLTDKEKPK